MTDVAPTDLGRRHLTSHRGSITPIATTAVLLSIVSLAFALQTSTYEVWGGFLVAPVLILATVPFARAAARSERDVRVGRFLMAAAVVKLVAGTAARYGMIYGLYDGGGDAEAYHKAGSELADQLRHFDYTNLGEISSTRSIEVLTGQVYAFLGPTKVGAFVFFSWLSLVGLFLFYFAFREAFPALPTRRLRWLLFLLPSELFWPSSIGKDAVMVFALGLATFGAAKLLNGRTAGLLLFAAGAWAAAVVRAHLTLILALALACAAACHAIQLARTRRNRIGSSRYLLMVGAVLVCIVLTVPAVESRFGLERLDASSADSILNETEGRTTQGGSSFDAPNPRTPAGYAASVVTVLFRPFVFEADDVASLVSATECLLLLLFCLLNLRAVGRIVTRSLTVPFLTFALAYTMLFCFAFGAIGNFGILCRQRTQLWPFVIILLAAGTALGPRRRPAARTAPHRSPAPAPAR